jgi:drug/metabolite transporter (DMT)-like permease
MADAREPPLASTAPDLDERAPPGLARAFWHALHARPYLLLTLTTLMWGGNAVASRLAVGHISPMAMTCLRWLGVCLVLAPFLGRRVASEAPALARRWPYVVVMSALGFTSFNALMYAAAHHTPAVNLTILQGSVPVLVLLGTLLLFGARIRLVQALGVAVTLVGVAIVAAGGEVETLAALAFNIGDVWMMIACAAYAAYTVLLRRRPAVAGFVFFAALAVAALLLSLPLLAWEASAGALVWPDARGFAILAYVTLFPSLLSQLFFMRGVELIGPNRAGLFVNLVPVFGALLAVLLLGEPFRLYHALALVLVLGGIWLSERGRA